MTEIWTGGVASLAATVPMGFIRIDLITGLLRLVPELHTIENKKLGFGPKVRGVGNACALEIALSPDGDRARVECVALTGDWIDRIGHQAKRGLVIKRIHPMSVRIRNQQHV